VRLARNSFNAPYLGLVVILNNIMIDRLGTMGFVMA